MQNEIELIAGLRAFVFQNPDMRDFFKRIEVGQHSQDALCLAQLEAAVESGDLNNEIFSNEHCSLYLLYLIDQKKIRFWAGISAYYYCMALMQFTDKQPLHSNDSESQLDKHVFAVPFMKEGVLTPEGTQYLKAIEKRYATELPALRFDSQTIMSWAESLSPMDQSLICISSDGFNNTAHALCDIFNAMKETAVKETLYLIDEVSVQREGQVFSCFVIPSFALMNLFNEMNSGHVVTFKPSMTLFSPEALKALYEKQDAYPLTLYSPFANTQARAESAKTIRGVYCGPFLASLCEMTRVAKMNFLTREERRDLVRDVVSVLEAYRNDEKILSGLKNQSLFSQRVSQIISQLTYHDYLSVMEFSAYKEKKSWPILHVLASLGRSRVVDAGGNASDGFNYGLYADHHAQPNAKAWSLVDDDMLYFIGCIGQRNVDDYFWRNLYQQSFDVAKRRERDLDVLDSIAAAVKSHKPPCARVLNFDYCFFSSPSQDENRAMSVNKSRRCGPQYSDEALSVRHFRS